LWDEYVADRLPGVRPWRGRREPHHIDNDGWSCSFYNRAKGERVSHGVGRRAIHFFDPWHDHWPRHFAYPAASGYSAIADLTPVGRVMAGTDGLDFNAGGLEGPVVSRHSAILNGGYPPTWARIAYNV